MLSLVSHGVLGFHNNVQEHVLVIFKKPGEKRPPTDNISPQCKKGKIVR